MTQKNGRGNAPKNAPVKTPQNASRKSPQNVSKNAANKQRPANRPPVRGSYESQSNKLKNAPPAGQRRAPESAARTRSSGRKRFRGGNYALYYVLGAIVLTVAFIILANTVLFNCAQITVSGNDKYSEDEIVEKSGVKIGDNLLHIKKSDAERNIIDALAYIDDAKVEKSFPTKVSITVTEAEKQYCVSDGGVTAIISRKGKIIEHGGADGLPLVKGYEPETVEVGKWLSSKTEGKTDIPAEIFEAADAAGLKNITEIDMTDKFSVNIVVENRIILELGPAEKVQSKLLVAVELINKEIGKDEYVTLHLVNPEKVPVQNNSLPRQSKPVSSSTVSSSVSSSSDNTAEPAPEPEPTSEPEPEPAPDPEVPAEQ